MISHGTSAVRRLAASAMDNTNIIRVQTAKAKHTISNGKPKSANLKENSTKSASSSWQRHTTKQLSTFQMKK